MINYLYEDYMANHALLSHIGELRRAEGYHDEWLWDGHWVWRGSHPHGRSW